MNGDAIEPSFFLSQMLGRKVYRNDRRIGKFSDLVIMETEVVPQVTHVVVTRSFGYKTLVVPFEMFTAFNEKRISLEIGELEPYERDNLDGLVLLNDHVMDKKVVDMEDHEIEVVYDIRLVYSANGLFVSDVDCSRYSFLRRIGLGRLARFISNLAASLSDETISWKFVQPLSKELGSFSGTVKLNVLKSNIADIHPMDLADILEELDNDQRINIFNQLDTEKASDTLEEIEPRVQREIISAIGDEKAAELIEDMTPAQAADVLSALSASDADDILALMDEPEKTRKIESLMDEHEKNILDFVTASYISFLPETTVGDVIRQYKDVAKDADVIWYVFVVSTNGKLVGVVNYHSILRSEPSRRLDEIMVSGVKALHTDTPLSEAAQRFDKYMFRAMPVIDDEEIMQGVVLYKDVMRLAHHLL